MPGRIRGAESSEPLFASLMGKLEDYFRTKRLCPGSKLPPERVLAAEFGVSRQTLREALKALNLFGILRSRPGDGTYVQRSLSGLIAKAVHLSTLLENVNYMDAFLARVAIEPTLARIAAIRVRREQLEAMRREIQGMELNLGNVEGYTRHEMLFHNLVIAAAGNPILNSVMTAISGLLLEARLAVTYKRVHRSDLLLHIQILEAIEARDPEAAHQAMARHLEVNRKFYEAYHRKLKRKADRLTERAALARG